MFRPKTSEITSDDLNEVEGDWSVTGSHAQEIARSALRQKPLVDRVISTDLGWPSITWNQQEFMYGTPGELDTRWDATFNNQTVTSPQGYRTSNTFLDIQTESGESQYHTQLAGGPAGTTYWPDNVDNSTGWTLQFRIQVLSDETGGDPKNNHSLVVDDGVHRERLFFATDGIYFENETGLYLSADMSTKPREVRLGALEDDFYLLLDDDRGIAGVNRFTGDSAGAELGFGTTGAVESLRTEWDYLHQFHGGVWGDTRPDVARVYETEELFATSPSYSPARPVSGWLTAYIHTSGTLAGGTTRVIPQYRSSLTSNVWQSATAATVDTIGQFSVDLSSIPVAGDETDQLRFKIGQVSTTGAGEAPRVEKVTVLTKFDQTGLRLHPDWGHTAGGNTIIIDLDMMSSYYFGQRPLSDQIELSDDPPSAHRLMYVPCNEDIVDVLNDETGSTTDIGYRPGLYTGAAYNIEYDDIHTAWDDNISTADESGSYGTWFGGCTPVGNPVLQRAEMYLHGGEIIDAQYAVGETGSGFSLEGPYNASVSHAYSGDDVLAGFHLQVEYGAIEVTHGTESHVFYSHDYKDSTWVALRPDDLNTADVSFMPYETGAAWRVGRPATYEYTRGTASIAVNHDETGAGWGAEGYFTAYEFGSDLAFCGSLSGNDGFEIGLDYGGFPYGILGDGASTDRVDGSWPVLQGVRHHYALNYKPYSDHDRLQLLVDGRVCAEKVTTLSTATSPATMSFGPIAGQFEEFATQSIAYDAADLSLRRGFTTPLMDSERDVPSDESNKAILRFERTNGAIVDDSGRANHAYTPLDGRSGIYRGVYVGNRRATSFWTNGAIRVLHTPDFTQSLPQSIYVRGRFWNYNTTQVLYSKWNSAGTVGWKVEILSDGTVRVTVEDGSTHTLTSSKAIADAEIRTLYAAVETSGITINIDGEEITSSVAISSLAAATEDAEIGRTCNSYLDTFVIRAGTVSSETLADWRDQTSVTRTVIDKVYVDDELVDPSRIFDVSPYRKYVLMPPHADGEVSVKVVIEQRSPGVPLVSPIPYTYTGGYTRTTSTGTSPVFYTKSPFRIVSQVPKDGVAMAFYQGPDIDVRRNVTMTDLSYKAAENLSTYFGGEFNTHSPIVSGSTATYQAQIDTADIRISNRAVMKRETAEPYPLYYKYLVGRKRYYVTNPNAITEEDIDLIRNSISVTFPDGAVAKQEEFPWDLEISKLDAYGNTLPANIFSVVIFSHYQYLQGTTLFVQYDSVDSLHSFTRHSARREVLNAVPIFEATDGTVGAGQYKMTLEDDGTYSLEVYNA